MSDLKSKTCAIIGGGPAGLAAALSLRKYTSIQPTVYELRSEPSTIGGAINLSPCGVLQLRHLGLEEIPGCDCQKMDISSAYSGARLGAMPMASKLGPAKRVLRADLQKVMLEAVQRAGIAVIYSARLSAVEESQDGVRLRFGDDSIKEHGFVLGCDGIFSTVRKAYVDPAREPQYTETAGAFAILPASQVKSSVPFDSAGVGIAPNGAYLMTYCDAEKSKIFFAVVLPFQKAPGSREDWVIWHEDKEKVLNEVRQRFQDTKLPALKEMLETVDELLFYPFIKLPNEGIWYKEKALLLGDAAHAMLPQGESSAFAIEDAILLGRIFSEHPKLTLEQVFQAYEKTRRPRISKAWKDANSRAGMGGPTNRFAATLLEWAVWGVLHVAAGGWQKKLGYDIREEPIVV